MMKSKIFKSKYSDVKVEVLENGWITLIHINEGVSICLGKPENLRIELLEKAIKYARTLK